MPDNDNSIDNMSIDEINDLFNDVVDIEDTMMISAASSVRSKTNFDSGASGARCNSCQLG